MMKKLLLFICMFMSMTLSGREYFYIDDVELGHDALGTTIVLDVKAHFDSWVSGWQVDFTLPQGITIGASSPYDNMNVTHLNAFGEEVVYSPSFSIGHDGKTIFVISMERDYDENGNFCGVVKWKPGDYLMFRTAFRISSDFTGGYITLLTHTACGQDTRPYVIPCLGAPVETNCSVTVDGAEIPPLPEYNEGTWLVVCKEYPEYMQIEANKYVTLDLTQDPNEYVPYHFLIDGVQYGADTPDKPTNTEDFLGNPLLVRKYNYILETNHKYIISVVDFGFGDLFILCILSDADELNEIANDSEISSIKYFNMSGQEISGPTQLCIKVIYYTNGSIKTFKICPHNY